MSSSSSSDSSTIEEGAQTSLPPMPLGEILRRIDTLQHQRRVGVTNLIREVGHGDFWTQTRHVQISMMLDVNELHGVTQTEIANVLGVSKSLVSRIKRRKRANLDVTGLNPGKPNELTVVFPLLKEFVTGETLAKRAVTKSVLMAFVSDHTVDPEATWEAVYTHMKHKGNAYKLCNTTDSPLLRSGLMTTSTSTRGRFPRLSTAPTPPSSSTRTRWEPRCLRTANGSLSSFYDQGQDRTAVPPWASPAPYEDARSLGASTRTDRGCTTPSSPRR